MRRWLLAGCVAGIVGLVLQAPLHAADGASPAASVERGAQLFALSCATCHGANGTGGVAPSLVGVGEAAADFQLRTGRMPRTSLDTGQAPRKPPAFNDEGIRDLVAYVASLGDGPAIPNVTAGSDVQRGMSLIIGNCAPCHGASAGGGVVGGGAIAPATTASPATPTRKPSANRLPTPETESQAKIAKATHPATTSSPRIACTCVSVAFTGRPGAQVVPAGAGSRGEPCKPRARA
jgi:mono/diheme cytochrome c family protein